MRQTFFNHRILRFVIYFVITSVNGNKLKIERAILDLTQEELAKKIGVSRQTINSIEKKQIHFFYSFSFKTIHIIQ